MQSTYEYIQTYQNFVTLERQEMPAWSLPRNPKPCVIGLAYWGLVGTLSGIKLSREILVLGYNHNLQSSFGVTNEVILAIRNWITKAVDQAAL